MDAPDKKQAPELSFYEHMANELEAHVSPDGDADKFTMPRYVYDELRKRLAGHLPRSS